MWNTISNYNLRWDSTLDHESLTTELESVNDHESYGKSGNEMESGQE